MFVLLHEALVLASRPLLRSHRGISSRGCTILRDAGCASPALRTAAERDQLWQQHCTARWKYPNKHQRRAGAGDMPKRFLASRKSVFLRNTF